MCLRLNIFGKAVLRLLLIFQAVEAFVAFVSFVNVEY